MNKFFNPSSLESGSENKRELVCEDHQRPVEIFCCQQIAQQKRLLCGKCLIGSSVAQRNQKLLFFDEFLANPNSVMDDDIVGQNQSVAKLLSESDEQIASLEVKVDEAFDTLIEEVEFELNNHRTRFKSEIFELVRSRDALRKSLKTQMSPEQLKELFQKDIKNQLKLFLKTVDEINEASRAFAQDFSSKKKHYDSSLSKLKYQISEVNQSGLEGLKKGITKAFKDLESARFNWFSGSNIAKLPSASTFLWCHLSTPELHPPFRLSTVVRRSSQEQDALIGLVGRPITFPRNWINAEHLSLDCVSRKVLYGMSWREVLRPLPPIGTTQQIIFSVDSARMATIIIGQTVFRYQLSADMMIHFYMGTSDPTTEVEITDIEINSQ